MGCVMQVGSQGLNIGRNAVLAAGFPESVPATTIDRQCGSSQQSAHFAAQGVIAGAYDVVVAAGVEVMTTTPMGASITPGSIPFGPKVMARYEPRRRPRAPGHLGRAHRRQVGPVPRGPRRLRRPQPAARRRRPPTRAASTTRSSRCQREAPRPGDRQGRRVRRARHRATRASAPARPSRRSPT